MAEQIDQLLSARKQLRQSRTSLRLQMQELSHVREALQALQPVVDKIDEQVTALDRQIKQLSSQDQGIKSAYTRLLKVHGVGPVTAAALATRLTSRDFPTADQFVAYIGLDIGIRQSGKRQGQTGLSKRGDAELRRLLYLCAQSNLRTKDSPFRAQYERERAKGLTSTGALCAVSRKIATICWALIHYNRQYDPTRVAQRPDAKPTFDNQELEPKEISPNS
jgi:transposase